MRVWAIAWDVFRRAQPRVGRGGWRAVDFVVCYGLGGFLMRPFFAYRQKSLFIMRPFFAFRTKKTFHTGVRTGCHYLISLSVCLSVSVSVCVTLVVLTDCKSCTRPISKNPGSMESDEYGQRVGRVSSHAVSRWSRSPGRICGVFWVRRDFVFFSFFFLQTHPACCKYEAALPHLPLY